MKVVVEKDMRGVAKNQLRIPELINWLEK